jgi:hypothetical protein
MESSKHIRRKTKPNQGSLDDNDDDEDDDDNGKGKQVKLYEIMGSHGREHEGFCLLRLLVSAVW